jgi:hypothetical protein
VANALYRLAQGLGFAARALHNGGKVIVPCDDPNYYIANFH